MEETDKSGKVEYKKDLRLIHLVMLNCMGMIGSGWLFASLYASSYAGPFGSIIAWVIGGIIVLFIALTFMEVSPMLPKAGGSTQLAEFSHGKMTGFMAGWSGWLSDVMTPPAEALAVVTYANYYMANYSPTVNSKGVITVTGYVIAAIAMFFMWFINTFKVKHMGDTTSAIMVWKWAIPVLTIIGIAAFAFHPSNFTAYGIYGSSGFLGVPTAIVAGGIVFSFLGFRGTVNLAAETKDPRTITKSIIIAVLTVTSLYILLDFVFVGGLDWGAAGVTAGNWTGLANGTFVNGPFAQEATEAGLGWLVVILLIDSVISPFGTGVTYEAYPARIFQAMAVNGYVPKIFGKLHPKTAIPFNALALSAVLGFAFLYKFPAWHLLIGILTSTLVVAYLIGPASISVFRKTVPKANRPYKLPFAYILSPIAFVLSYLAVYWSAWPLTWQVAAVIFAGFIIYFYFHIRSVMNKDGLFTMRDITASLWYVIGLIVIVIESYIGPTYNGGINIIPAGVDIIVVIISGFVFYFLSLITGWLTPSLKKHMEETGQEI